MRNRTTGTLRAVALGVALSAVATANATTYSFSVGRTDTRSLGDVINNTQGQFGGQAERDAYMVNNLLSLRLTAGVQVNQTVGVGTEYYSESFALPNNGSLPTATHLNARTQADAGGLNNVGNNDIQITLTARFQYLVVAYDGPNGGAEIYNVSDLLVGDILLLPANAYPTFQGGGGPNPPHDTGPLIESTGQYGMTGWALLNPGNPPRTDTPEGGATIALLGLALAGIGAARRVIKG